MVSNTHTPSSLGFGAGRVFVVSVHDVAPRFAGEISAILAELGPKVGRTISAAVIPEACEPQEDSRFLQRVRESCEEIALHGFSHQTNRRWNPISLLTNGANEFTGLTETEAENRLLRGQNRLRECFGSAATVFVPPAWCLGPVNVKTAARAGISALVSFWNVQTARRKVPLATYSWDCGRLGWLGFAGEWPGQLWQGVPCVTFHPADVRRGFLVRGCRRVNSFLKAGYRPVTFEQCMREFQEGEKSMPA